MPLLSHALSSHVGPQRPRWLPSRDANAEHLPPPDSRAPTCWKQRCDVIDLSKEGRVKRRRDERIDARGAVELLPVRINKDDEVSVPLPYGAERATGKLNRAPC